VTATGSVTAGTLRDALHSANGSKVGGSRSLFRSTVRALPSCISIELSRNRLPNTRSPQSSAFSRLALFPEKSPWRCREISHLPPTQRENETCKPAPADEDEACRLARENETLRTRLNLIKDAVENVRHGLCVFAPDGTIAFCNRRYPEVIGLPPGQVGAGLAVRELIEMGQEAGFYPGRTLEDVEKEFWRNLSSERATHGAIQRCGRTYVVHPGRTSAGNFSPPSKTSQPSARRRTRSRRAKHV
jgi:PAS domain-containing protein